MRTITTIPVPLFRSDTQAALLSALFMSDERFTVQDLSDRLGIPYPTIHREITRLLKSSLLSEVKSGNYRFFTPNHFSPFYRPLHDLLQVFAGPIPLLKKEFESIPNIEWSALFGSWAKRLLGKDGNFPRDVDVLVVGTPDVHKIYSACSSASKSLGWEVNPVILTPSEWKEETPFLAQVREDGFILIVGQPD